MNDNQAICLKCGVKTGEGQSFCSNCGSTMNPGAEICLNCGVSQKPVKDSNSNKLTKVKEGKILAGVHSGLGKKFGCSPWIFRIIHLLSHFLMGIGIFLTIGYIIAAIAMPNEEE